MQRDPAAGLEENLVRFVHILRRLGVPVNPAESVDALTALGLVDLTERRQVRSALRATLVKSEDHLRLFDLAFDLFFLPPEELQARVKERREARSVREAQARKASLELRFQGEPLDLTPEQLETYTRLGELQKERLKDFLAESSAGHKVDRSFQPLIESIVRGHLDRWRRKLGVRRRRTEHLTGDETLDTVIEGALDGRGAWSAGSGGDPLMHVDMKDISDADFPRAARLVGRLARRLATRLSRRYRESHKRRRPNLRRTIRSNIKHGGVLFDLRYRERRVTRPRLVLVCDVSGSMARYTAFILEFIFGLASAVRGVETFVFSEELERLVLPRQVSDPLRAPAGRPGGSGAGPAPGPGFLASEIIGRSRVWGKGTDLGRALETLVAEHGHLLTGDAVVILVSDTKTLGADRAAELLGRIRPRVREIVWLNTLPQEEWKDHRTVALFARHASMHECYTLAHLERVIRLGVGRNVRPR